MRARSHRLPIALALLGLLAATPAEAKPGLFGWVGRVLGGSNTPRAALNRTERQAVSRGGRAQSVLNSLERKAEAGGSPLHPDKILGGYRQGKYRVVAFDRENGARKPEDRASKFVVIEDRFGGGNHLLGIPTPSPSKGSGRQNVSWLHRVDPKKANHLGRMVRGTLAAVTVQEGRAPEAFVNMPGGALTVGTLHVHGVGRNAKPRDWRAFESAHAESKVVSPLGAKGYQLYRAGDGLVALASASAGAPAKLSSRQDKLVGQMFLDLSRAATAAGLTGQIAMSRSGDRIAVEVRPLRKRGPRFSLLRFLGF